MWQRVKTALVLLVLVAVGLFGPGQPYPMLALMLLTATLAAREWLGLLPDAQSQRRYYWFIPVTLLAAIAVLRFKEFWPVLWAAASLYWVVSFFWVKQFPQRTPWFNTPTLLASGGLSILAAVSAIYALWQVGPLFLLYVFGIVWIADSGAYFVGRKLGRRKLIPQVSPNKTVEGLLGGLALVMLYVILADWLLLGFHESQLIFLIVISLITALFSVLGDLVESMHKRQAGVKD